ncbi:MAG: pyrroline-5-carboxylate reductase [Gammaproteobacteria bacterium]|nr:pyrroline-5-carboxylate reductase [Gammaproteobacteria bacterium]
MTHTSIGFIGGGNMAGSLIGGLIADGWPTDKIRVSDPDNTRREHLSSHFSIQTSDDNIDILNSSDVLVLAVKPQVMAKITQALASSIQQTKPLIISIAAGINLTDLSRWLGDYKNLIRTMPNTPAMVQSGATALFADKSVDQSDRDLAETIMRAVGLTLWVDTEDQIDAVTAVSGSGPAYFFYIMEAMEKAGVDMGLSAKNARLLTIQTAFGAAKMALESKDSPGQLRQKVTSPGGTTERALSIMEDKQLQQIFNEALNGARQRSHELARILGQQT